MTVSDEEIMAYADGALDEEARARITQAALSDFDLADRIAAQRALRERLQAHFAPVAQEPIPATWVETIRQGQPSAQVIDMAAARAKRAAKTERQPSRWRAWVGGAVAACLAVALFATSRQPSDETRSPGEAQPIVARNGVLVASGELAHALDRQLASAQEGAPIRMLGTFHRAGGDLCRAFAGPQAAGIACRAGEEWQLQHVLPGSQASSAAYRQAGSQDGTLMAIAQSMTQGAPLDATQEKTAQEKGWR
jgi:hypothetical protein